MTMANNTKQCFTCKQHKRIIIPCQGCSKEFCQMDFKEHQQLLNEELNFIINDYDQFRQKINKQEQNPQHHSLIKHIDQWETNSIEIIKQKAQNCRQSVFDNMKICFKEIEQKLNELNEQIKEIQRENEFNEIDLDDLRRKLNKMNEELNNSSNISIREDRQSFINEISIVLSKNDLKISSPNHFNNLTANILSIQQQKKTKFQQNGKIVAGGNGRGNQLNQFSCPQGIFVDENKTIFIADCGNHRIVQWKCNAKEGQIIAGGNGEGNRMDQVNKPIDVIVNQQNHSIIIADRENRRVMRWSRDQKQQILIDNISCSRLTMDEHGFLYISDREKHEVRKWKLEKMNENKEGILIAGGNGKGNQLVQLNGPTFIFVDKDQSVYVSDSGNNRVMKWRKDASEGIVVAGRNQQGNNFNQLNFSQGLFVDKWNQIYVVDCGNHRIMRWCEGNEEGEIVVGGNGRGSELNQLNGPESLAFDLEGNLYVSDYGNHRIVRFDKIQ